MPGYTGLMESNGCGGFQIEVINEEERNASALGGIAKVSASSVTNTSLTGAGVVAILARFSTYYTAAKVTAIRRHLGLEHAGPLFGVTPQKIVMLVLPADLDTEAANIRTDLRVAANVGTQP